MKKSVTYIAALFIALFMFAIPAYAQDIDVKLDNIVSNSTIRIDFDTVAPMTIEDSTVVPLRKFCESAGLEVHWTDESKTAYVTLNAGAESSLPIERYAYRLLSSADTKGLPLIPENITVSMTVADENLHLRYNYKDIDGDVVSIGKNIRTDVPATVVSTGSIVVPVRGLMEALGLWVEWSDNSVTVSIPPFDVPAENLEIVPTEVYPQNEVATDVWYGSVEKPVQAVVVEPGSAVPKGAVYLGNFRITHYCSCTKCCGQWGNATAWAGKIVPGYTIAVDPKVIPKLSTVYIDGYGIRRAEDCGGAIKGNKIDVAVSNHAEAMKLGVAYKDVWIIK